MKSLYYYNSNVLLVVNQLGLIRVLYTPFRVQCIEPIDQIRLNTWVYVEEVFSSPKDELVYLIYGHSYSYKNFRVQVNGDFANFANLSILLAG
jgi:hypothetical protein